MALSNTIKPAKEFSVDDLITCGICHNEIDDARSLVCLHTYCLECLREWNKVNRSKNEVICPLCREPTPLKENGVDGLRRNFIVTKLKDRTAVSRQLMNKDVRITCTSCDISVGNEAVARCLECNDFLCRDCHKAHKLVRLTKNHSMLTLEELRAGKSNFKKSIDDNCKDHPGQVLWFYCKSCDMTICRDCTVIKHPTNSHVLITIEEAAAGQREEMQRLVRLCNDKKEELDEGFKKIHHIQCNLDSTQNAVKIAIDGKKEKIKKSLILSLENQAGDLKTRVSELTCARKKAALIHVDELQILNSRLKTALDMASHVSSDGSDCDVASVYKHLTTTLHQLVQIRIPAIDTGEVRFKEDVSPMTSVGTFIGSVQETKIANSTHDVPVRVISGVISKKNWNIPWTLIKKYGDLGKQKLRDPRGVVINLDGNVAVADYDESNVKVYDKDSGELKMSVDTTQGLPSYPSDCTSSPLDVLMYQGNYIVSDETRQLTIYNKQGHRFRQIPLRWIKDDTSAGIAINSQGHVLVGYYDTKSLDIYRYTDGEPITSLDIPYSAWYIAVSNSTDDNIVISDYWYNACVVINSNGQKIHKLRPPSVIKSRWYPTGICTIGVGDKEEVLVCNCSNYYQGDAPGVYRFTLSTGKYLGCVTTEVTLPHGITFTTDGKLVVTDTGRRSVSPCIKMFIPIGLEQPGSSV